MAGRYRQSQNKNRSRFYIMLSVIFVVVMFKWGIPLLMNLVAGNGGERAVTGKDIIPPQSPIYSALPDATNSARIIVEGFTEAGANVQLMLNDTLDKAIKADETGAFKMETVLIAGQNKIQLKAKDEAGNESTSEASLVNFDNKPVDLVVTSPKDGSEYFGKNSQTIDIIGSVNKTGTTVLLNGSYVQVSRDGSFSSRFSLSGGDNNLKLSATDAAGNTDEQTIKVVYTP